jgi:hypothetical protein
VPAEVRAVQPNLYGGLTECGYCGRLLEPAVKIDGDTVNVDGCWECPACAPQLRALETVEEWAAWCKRKRR